MGCSMQQNPFYGFDQEQIDQGRDGNKDEKAEWQRSEAEHPCKGAERQVHSDSHYCKARCKQRNAGTAAQWILRCADDEDDQCLGGQRLDKPAGVKLRLAGAKEMQQYIESQEVEDGTDGSDQHHEIPDDAYIPPLGLDQVGLVNVVRWNRNLGQVVKEVVQQNLCGQHGQE